MCECVYMMNQQKKQNKNTTKKYKKQCYITRFLHFFYLLHIFLIIIFQPICNTSNYAIFTFSGKVLKSINQFTYIGSHISLTESNTKIHITKALSIVWKSDLSDKIKRDLFGAVAMSVLLYRCTTWTLTKCLKKKLDGN